jgi:hypothetical protein
MRIYEVEYNAETPIILSRPSVTNVFHNSYKYLPGSTIRGAILTYLKRNNHDIKEEMVKPSMLFHPAFPVKDDLVFKPAQVLLYKCKLCKDEKDPYNVVNPYKVNLDDCEIPFKCKNDHPFALKPIGGELIAVKDGKKVEKYEPKYAIFDSVGINRVTASSDVNLLYTYIALINAKYKGLIVTNDSCKFDLEKLLDGKVIFVGKGINRGFGCLRVKIKEKSKNGIIKKYSRLNDKIVLKALSPIFNINISNNGLVTNYEFKIKSSKCKIWSNGLIDVSGFSIVSNTEKVKITALKEGSLLITNNISEDDIVDILLNGIGPFACSGFNIVEVLDYDSPY